MKDGKVKLDLRKRKLSSKLFIISCIKYNEENIILNEIFLLSNDLV
jgi:hypothetical protein